VAPLRATTYADFRSAAPFSVDKHHMNDDISKQQHDYDYKLSCIWSPVMNRRRFLYGAALLILPVFVTGCSDGSNGLLNVSYDPTRELWKDLNRAFTKQYADRNGIDIKIEQSHGGSSTQARSVIDGLEADVVTLAMWQDTDAIRKKGLIKEGWEDRFPNRALPYSSTIVFVVRKGNPKDVKDWNDLAREDIQVITPNPKTSGNGKLSFLAAWGYVINKGGSETDAVEFVRKIYKNVPVLDSGARGSTTTFAQKNLGDVHLTWENEAYLEVEEAKGELEIVIPPSSIRAEPHVAVVDSVVERKGTSKIAEDYLNFLYTYEGQEIIAKHNYRPTNPEVLAKHKDTLRDIELFPITKIANDWDEAGQRFFADGGVFDQIYTKQ
jgi:sulfate/thiosulfate-binding protein